MDPSAPTLTALLAELRASADPVKAAYAHNYLFEERVGPERQAGYEGGLSPGIPTATAWRGRHARYLYQRVWVPVGESPETFTPLNGAAQIASPAETQFVVRLESLRLPLDWGPTSLGTLVEALSTWREAKDPQANQDAAGVLRDFCQLWNQVRFQDRPAFAAFYSEVADDCTANDWPHRLRNRLGLAHYDVPAGGSAIPVALVRYRVEEVLTRLPAAERTRAFAVPTVLDGDLNPYFFPGPKQAEYGRTVDLEGDLGPDCERLVSEVLHRRVDYRPEHLFRLGQITEPVPPSCSRDRLAALRNGHLFCLQLHAERDDFGEEIKEPAGG